MVSEEQPSAHAGRTPWRGPVRVDEILLAPADVRWAIVAQRRPWNLSEHVIARCADRTVADSIAAFLNRPAEVPAVGCGCKYQHIAVWLRMEAERRNNDGVMAYLFSGRQALLGLADELDRAACGESSALSEDQEAVLRALATRPMHLAGVVDREPAPPAAAAEPVGGVAPLCDQHRDDGVRVRSGCWGCDLDVGRFARMEQDAELPWLREECERLRVEHAYRQELIDEHDRAWRARLAAAEQERDEARRERDAARAEVETTRRCFQQVYDIAQMWFDRITQGGAA